MDARHCYDARRPFLTTVVALLVVSLTSASEDVECHKLSGSGGCASEIIELPIQSEVYGNSRMLRVLLPASYHHSDDAYPVFYFLDGVATMDAFGLDLPGVLEQLKSEPPLREFIIVAIDNGGSTSTTSNPAVDRAAEYIPYPDPSWTEPPVPVAKGKLFPDFLFGEIEPLISETFRVRNGAENTGIGGYSYGGLAALYTIVQHPERIGLAIIESPSLHVSEGRIEGQLDKLRSWQGRIHLGVGTAEGETLEHQREMVQNVLSLASAIRSAAPDAELNVALVNGGTHWFDAWRARLPGAIRFVFTCESAQMPGCADQSVRQ